MSIKSNLVDAHTLLEKCISDDSFLSDISESGLLMLNCIRNGSKILVCGNGGSMCDAMHFAEEMTGSFKEKRRAFPVIAISDPAHITCSANDFGFETIFSRYIEAVGKSDDILFVITTSGKSMNIIDAVKTAKKLGMHIIGLTGNLGGELTSYCDLEICVPYQGASDRIQEIHIKIIHSLVDYIEQKI